jgi:hypothetical protein
MKRVLILILAITSLAAARDKKPKALPGPYIFSSKASAQTLKTLIVQANLSEGYALDSDDQFQFRFSKPAQMPIIGALFMASSACPDMTTKKVWSYTLTELNGMTKVAYKLRPRHSRRAFFNAGCVGKGLGDASVLLAFRYPPRRQ